MALVEGERQDHCPGRWCCWAAVQSSIEGLEELIADADRDCIQSGTVGAHVRRDALRTALHSVIARANRLGLNVSSLAL